MDNEKEEVFDENELITVIHNDYDLLGTIRALHRKCRGTNDEFIYVGMKIVVSEGNSIFIQIISENGDVDTIEISRTMALRLRTDLEKAFKVSFENHNRELEHEKKWHVSRSKSLRRGENE